MSQPVSALIEQARVEEALGDSRDATTLWLDAARADLMDDAALEAVSSALVRLGYALEALEACHRAARRPDGSAYAWRQAAVIQFNNLSDVAGAVESLEQAVARHPGDSESLLLLATVAFQALDFAKAHATGLKALEIGDLRVAMKVKHRLLGDYEGAVEAARAVLEQAPADLEALIHNGLSLTMLGRYDEACGVLYRAAQHEPHRGDVLFPLANALLLAGDSAAGWARYNSLGDEGPLRRIHPAIEPHLSKFWRGQSLDGRRILVLHYVGLGDNIMYARYLRALKAAGAHVTFCCKPELYRLFEGLEGADALTSDWRFETWGDYDLWVFDILLPERFGAGRGHIPAYPEGYLRIPEMAISKEGRRPDGGPDRLRVGLCWTTAPVHFSGKARCLDPEDLRPLAEVPDVDWYVLQKRPREPDFVERSGLNVLDFSAEWSDFLDTAQFVAELDLTISIDSAPIHLSGALGLPIWALIPEPPEWRWGARGATSDWYPQARIFRQPQSGDWLSVTKAVVDAIATERATLMGRRLG